MRTIQLKITMLLQQAAEQLREIKISEELLAELDRLAERVNQPCVVAVIGQVNAGKSSFINAFLGDDLAVVGVEETTAMINYFRYDKSDSSQDVRMRCFWHGGQESDVSLDFVKRLQGHDAETLRLVGAIDRLEYYLEKPYLEHVTLVDTPGLNSSVSEHQKTTETFIPQADAVIYLMDSTARMTDQDVLEVLQQLTQGQARAFNAIGVIAKVDSNPELVKGRTELAAKIAQQFKENLNTVIPVSAGVQRALDRLELNDGAGLQRLMEAMRRIPAERIKKFLRSDEFYYEASPDDYPISIEERRDLLLDIPIWTVFTTIASKAADSSNDIDALRQQLREIAGFDQLRVILKQHFFERSQILHCHHILEEARKIVETIKSTHLLALRQQEREEQAQVARFLSFIHQAAFSNPEVAQELETFVKNHLIGPEDQEEIVVEEMQREIDAIFYQLDRYNADFETLYQIRQHNHLLTEQERHELYPLLGQYGLELERRLPPGKYTCEYVAGRQIAWMQRGRNDTTTALREIAMEVASCYSHILAQMSNLL